MKIIHKINNITKNKNVDKQIAFLLTNKKGGFTSFGYDSKYCGCFFKIKSKLYKIIENIVIDGMVTTTTNKFYSINKSYNNGVIESFFTPHNSNSIVYELNKETTIKIVLDIRHPYDNSEENRNYSIFEEKGIIIVKFYRENERDSIYLAIKLDTLYYQITNEWHKKIYKYDKARNSNYERWVYNALRIKAKKIVFSASDNKEKAIREAETIFNKSKQLLQKQKNYYKKFKDKNLALLSAKIALDSLITNDGIYAGLPWFFQEWTRDELVSIKALRLLKQQKIIKKILLKNLENILIDGRIPTIIGSSNGCADSIGWLILRLKENMNIFSDKEKKQIIKKLKIAVEKIEANYKKDGLFYNNKKETWMDSIDREGFRIEIQALMLAVYNFMFKITNNSNYRNKELQLKKIVREKFWNGKILADGLNDFTIRPNIFISCYVYPQLLTRKEWELCFENALEKLWLEWGGISSVDKTDLRFIAEHTGENPQSYHNGDSWYWLNNLAAITIIKVNKKKFKSYINEIINSSSNDILWNGALACHSELSSAKQQTSEGCLNQAWSDAMFIELLTL